MFYKAIKGQIIASRKGRIEASEYKGIYYFDLDRPIPDNPKIKLSTEEKEYVKKLFESRKYESFSDLEKEVKIQDEKKKGAIKKEGKKNENIG
jgi:hypothetical protein